MRARYTDSPLWHLLPPEPQRASSFRRSNWVVITILAFFTFGLLVVGFVEAHNNFAGGKVPAKTVNAVQSAHHVPSVSSKDAARTN